MWPLEKKATSTKHKADQRPYHFRHPSLHDIQNTPQFSLWGPPIPFRQYLSHPTQLSQPTIMQFFLTFLPLLPLLAVPASALPSTYDPRAPGQCSVHITISEYLPRTPGLKPDVNFRVAISDPKGNPLINPKWKGSPTSDTIDKLQRYRGGSLWLENVYGEGNEFFIQWKQDEFHGKSQPCHLKRFVVEFNERHCADDIYADGKVNIGREDKLEMGFAPNGGKGAFGFDDTGEPWKDAECERDMEWYVAPQEIWRARNTTCTFKC